MRKPRGRTRQVQDAKPRLGELLEASLKELLLAPEPRMDNPIPPRQRRGRRAPIRFE
ncbi:MAG TPA: hypothetical protein VNO21_22895 [Polyangiaceae bacterium]|nr:hypothetical protein [Polyangiaceae bacterium]